MFLKSIFVLLFYSYIGGRRVQADIDVVLVNSSPAICGANVTFTATVTNYTGELLNYLFFSEAGSYKSVISNEPIFNLSVEFKKEECKSGRSYLGLMVNKKNGTKIVDFGLFSTYFTLTDRLNGNLKMIQRGIDNTDDFVYPYEPVYHYLEIPHEEHMYLEKEPSQRLYYWYINCKLIQVTREFCILHTYTDAQETYDLRVVLVVKKKSQTTTTPKSTDPTTPRRYNHWYYYKNSETTDSKTPRRYNNSYHTAGTFDRNYNHYIAKRNSTDGYASLFDNNNDKSECLPDIDGYAYGVYDQTIRIIDPNELRTSTERSSPTSTFTTDRSPTWPEITIGSIESPTDRNQTWPISTTTTESPVSTSSVSTDKGTSIKSVKPLNSTIGVVPAISLATLLRTQTTFSKPVHFKIMLNIDVI